MGGSNNRHLRDMTAIDKAEYLVNKFKPHAYNGAYEEKDERMESYNAKQCAQVAVDEILKIVPQALIYTYSYWLEVKREIENL